MSNPELGDRLAAALRQTDDRKIQAYNDLRKCCGHWQNGTETAIRILQDDATHSFIIYVGNRRYWGEDLMETLAKAAADQED